MALTYVKRSDFFRLVLRTAPMVGAIALTAALGGAPAWSADYAWPVTRVIDGDTVEVNARSDLPAELSDLKVRLRGVDTPEIGGHAECAAEKAAGRAATEFTEEQIKKAGRIAVRSPAWGSFGGRVIADLMLDGQSLSAMLIAAGHGRVYKPRTAGEAGARSLEGTADGTPGPDFPPSQPFSRHPPQAFLP